jgi:GntR family transcriptional repressor for pyruvate dehydrogenase complex
VGLSIFTPVRPKTAFDETLNRLENAIKLGLLPPGSRLPAERELCTQLGISRSTLRQALMALTSCGYLHATRGRGGGTFVVDSPPGISPPSEEDLARWRDLCEERLATEVGVVALAASRARTGSLTPLERIASELETSSDPVRSCQLDRHFHIAIAELTESSRLVLASTAIQAAIFDLTSTIIPTYEHRQLTNAGHRAIIEALRESDQQTAIGAMCTHLGMTTTLFDQEFASQAAR